MFWPTTPPRTASGSSVLYHRYVTRPCQLIYAPAGRLQGVTERLLQPDGSGNSLKRNWPAVSYTLLCPPRRPGKMGGGKGKREERERMISPEFSPANTQCPHFYPMQATTNRTNCKAWMSAVESYAWRPSHDQCGMLRPSGTSSADWW